jgi:hypothetical protein
MEKSILQLSKESLTELSSLPHLKTEPKAKPKPKKREGTAGRIGPATLPTKKKKTTVGPKTSDRITSAVKTHVSKHSDTYKKIGSSIKDTAIEKAKEVGKAWVGKIGDKLKPKD